MFVCNISQHWETHFPVLTCQSNGWIFYENINKAIRSCVDIIRYVRDVFLYFSLSKRWVDVLMKYKNVYRRKFHYYMFSIVVVMVNQLSLFALFWGCQWVWSNYIKHLVAALEGDFNCLVPLKTPEFHK